MRYRRGWILVVLLALLSPLGLLAIGTAWGEWDIESLAGRIGFEPAGMKRVAESGPRAPIPDYEIPGLSGSPIRVGIGTIVSALLGAAATAGAIVLISRMIIHGRIS